LHLGSFSHTSRAMNSPFPSPKEVIALRKSTHSCAKYSFI
jgi:hypothetical protein